MIGVVLAAIGHELSAQPQGPIKLFPELAPEEALPPTARPSPGPAAPPAARGVPEVEAPQEITVEGLAAPQVDAIGLGGGLDPDLWAGSTPEIALALIARLPLDANNPPLRDLARRLLLTGATFRQAEAPGRMLAARVERLLMAGALGDAEALLDQLPSRGADTPLARSAAEVALWRGNVERACGLADDTAAASGVPFWSRIVVFCRLQEGDVAGAQLALDLLRDAGAGGDPLFLALAEGLAAGDASAVEISPPIDALHVAMLRTGRRALPQAVLEEAPPQLLAAALGDPVLAPVVTPDVAERAYSLGAIDVQRLREIYRRSAAAEAGEPLDLVRSAPGPEARALAYKAASNDRASAVTARLFDVLWRRADASERLMLGQVFLPALSGLSPREDLLFAAPSITPALLTADRPAPALRWFGFLRQRAATDAGAREAAHALAPLFGLAGLGEGDQVPKPDHATLEAWQAAVPDAEFAPEALYALFDGLGTPVPLDLWWQSSDAAPATAVTAPPPSIWRTLARAREEGRRGELIAAALALLGAAEAGAPPEATVQGLGALRQAGFGSDARAIAVASALLQGF